MRLQRLVRLALSISILLALLADVAGLHKYPFLQQLENWTYDSRLNFTRLYTVDDRIVIVDIDERFFIKPSGPATIIPPTAWAPWMWLLS